MWPNFRRTTASAVARGTVRKTDINCSLRIQNLHFATLVAVSLIHNLFDITTAIASELYTIAQAYVRF